MSTENTTRQNTLFDEVYNNYVFTDVTINTIEPAHTAPVQTDTSTTLGISAIYKGL